MIFQRKADYFGGSYGDWGMVKAVFAASVGFNYLPQSLPANLILEPRLSRSL